MPQTKPTQTTKRSRDEIIADDVADLHGLGYAQELFRAMGRFSNFAISFSIVSILTGAVILYGYGLTYGGPGINGWGWPIVSLFTLLIAAAMAEIASAYPTAGGLYYWASRLGSRHWGWWTAWLNLGGLVTAVAGINWAAAAFFNRIVLQEFFDVTPSLGKQLVVMTAITAVQVGINVYGIRLVALLNDLSVWVHIGGVLLIALTLFAFAEYRHDVAYPFTLDPAESVRGDNLPFWGAFGIFGAFLLGLLQAQWTYTGYDASAHTAEETIGARKASAWGIFLAVAVSAVAGYVLLLAITFALPPITATLDAEAAGTPSVAYTLIENLENVGVFLCFVIVVAMLLCGLSAIASTGRMIYAFARDGGVPASPLFSHVSPRYRTPDVALLTAGLLAVAICAYAYTTDDVIKALGLITGMSTNLLYWAYGIPIFLGLRNPEWRSRSVWRLGRYSRPAAYAALTWIAIISMLFLWWPNNQYTVQGTAMFAGLLLIYYLAWARFRFAGPRTLSSVELRHREQVMGEAPVAAD
jgi:amino acid transporter